MTANGSPKVGFAGFAVICSNVPHGSTGPGSLGIASLGLGIITDSQDSGARSYSSSA